MKSCCMLDATVLATDRGNGRSYGTACNAVTVNSTVRAVSVGCPVGQLHCYCARLPFTSVC